MIDAALTGSTEGQGRFVILYGRSGIGRSTLLAAAIRQAELHGIAILSAFGSELERGYGFGIVRQLLEARIAQLPAAERRSLLNHAGPAAAAALGIGPLNEASPGAGFDQLESVYRLVTRLSPEAPLLVAVDDLQWCDRPSLDFLCFLGHRAGQLPVIIIGAWRRGEPHVKAGRLQSLAAMPQTSFLSLAPLGREGVRTVLRNETGSSPGDAAVDAVLRQTGGEPFLVKELTGGLRLRGVPLSRAADDAIEHVTPESVRRNVVARLGRHPEPVQGLARAVAVLGDGSMAQVGVLAGLDPAVARSAVDALVRAGLFRDDSTVAYAQPILQRAVYETLSSLERAELHRAAAMLLCGSTPIEPAGAHRVALHLLGCEAAAEPRFVDALCVAAGRSVEAGLFDEAYRFYERALGEAEGTSMRQRVLIRLAQVEIASRDFRSAAAHAAESLETVSSPSERAESALVGAEALACASDWAGAVALLESAADSLAEPDSGVSLDLRASAAVVRACAGGSPPHGASSRRALERLAGATVAERKMLAALAHELTISSDSTAARVREVCKRVLAADASPGGGLFGEAAGYLACRAALLADGDELVEQSLNDRANEPIPCAVRSELLALRGELVPAEETARRALLSLETLAPSPLRDRVQRRLLLVVALAAVERGRLEEADAALTRLVDDDGEGSAEAILVRMAVRLAQGAPDVGAAVEAERTDDAIVATAGSLRAWAALTHRAAGNDARGLALATEHLERARTWAGPSVLGHALIVRGAQDKGREQLRFLEEAVAVLEQSPSMLERARAALEYGAALRRSGRRGESREHLVRGADLAQRCGADVLASRARTELVATGARPRRAAFTGVDALTVAERRVALLAAAGMTKREIARELTVSMKTVSGQLSAVYLKLDVHDRDALAAVMETGAGARS